MSYLLLISTAGSATDRLFASVYGPAPINVWRPMLVVLRLLLIPFGLVSGHLEYVPPGDDGDAIYMMGLVECARTARENSAVSVERTTDVG